MRPSIPRSSSAVALLAAALGALAACHGDTAPRRGVAVTMKLTALRGPFLGTDTAGRPTITCETDLAASATGVGSAKWLDGTYYYYDGKTRTSPRATFTMQAKDISDGWSSDTIAAGQTLHSAWDVTSGIPFSGEMYFGYDDGVGGSKLAKVAFTCGPTVSDSTPAPVLTSFQIVPPSGNLPAGAPLTVAYAASARSGLWQTWVRITGPCVYQQVFFEALHDSVSREISVPMPTTCLHGVPIYVDVAVQDAAAQVVDSSVASSIVVADRQPLAAVPLFFRAVQPAPGAVQQRDTGTAWWRPLEGRRSPAFAPRPVTSARPAPARGGN